MAGTSHYNTKGLYTKYDKNHKERDALDYYATPTTEVENILNTLNINFINTKILEPCVGGGHMADGIDAYLVKQGYVEKLITIGTDIKDRGYKNEAWELEYGLDFFADDYPYYSVDWIIMNPPYSVIEPFVIRALEIAQKGVIMLGRTQFLEGQGRYENIFQFNPPTEVYTYVDRIQCYKNGDIDIKGSSAQAYSWFIWKKEEYGKDTVHHWIRRADKLKNN